MSIVEARTSAALHDVVDALPVTENDVARMESDLFEVLAAPRVVRGAGFGATGLRGARARRRRWGLVAAAVATAAVVVGLVLTGDPPDPAQPARPPVSDQPFIPPEVVGTWRLGSDSRHVWVFVGDGRVSVDPTADDFLEADFKDRVVSRTGDLYTVHTEDGCDEVVRIRQLRPGVVGLAAQRTSCDPTLGPEPEERMLERVSPQPYLGGALGAPLPTVAPGFAPQSTFLDGVWLHPASGTVLAIGRPWRSGLLTYVLDDDGDGKSDPDQRGRVTMRDGTAPVFRRDSADRSACQLTFTSVVVVHTTMSTTSEAGGCLLPGTWRWARIS
ncbi:hypothetical protein ACOCJ5_15860 [Knoellia sp. CPCC 206450]|uniref:hypothetical protein n=1 Tax=Knoellia tibetensis TaxID=3404798 RepID=UPI003B43BF3F